MQMKKSKNKKSKEMILPFQGIGETQNDLPRTLSKSLMKNGRKKKKKRKNRKKSKDNLFASKQSYG